MEWNQGGVECEGGFVGLSWHCYRELNFHVAIVSFFLVPDETQVHHGKVGLLN